MKKILVPVDFSKPSKVAALYAIRLAKDIGAHVTLLHVINANPSAQTLMNWQVLENELKKVASEDFAMFQTEIAEQIGSNAEIDYRIETGFPIERRIEEFTSAEEIDVIIMGTKGASGLKGILMGSNALAVINSSSVPVITVPPDEKFTTIRNIVYASDRKNIRHEIRKIALFAKVLHAHLHILHVTHEDGVALNTYSLERELVEISKFSDFEIHVVAAENTVDAINEYFQANHADLLIMFTEKMNYFKKLFGKSSTRKIALQARIPLLTLNKTAAEFAIMQRWEFDLNFT